MKNRVIQFPKSEKSEWFVYVTGQREPAWVEAEEFVVGVDDLLKFMTDGNVVAVFNNWDYFQRMVVKPVEEVA